MLQSASKAQIKALRQLQASAAQRVQSDRVIVEGETLIREACHSGWKPVEFYFRRDWEARAEEFLRQMGGIGYMLSPEAFERVSDVRSPQGILGVFQPSIPVAPRLKARRILALERVQDPGNAGTLLRTAEAAGVESVLYDARGCDVHGPKALRAAMGSAFRMPVQRSQDFLEDVRLLARQKRIPVVGAALEGENLYAVAPPNGYILLIGNEAQGLSEQALAICDVRVRIPMRGNVESLNAAAAGAVLLYHLNQDILAEE